MGEAKSVWLRSAHAQAPNRADAPAGGTMAKSPFNTHQRQGRCPLNPEVFNRQSQGIDVNQRKIDTPQTQTEL
jgi:hypothetical protein